MRCRTPGIRNVAQMKRRRGLDGVEQQAERKEDQRPPEDVASYGARRAAPASEREGHRRAHREEQKRKHEIGERPAVPQRVLEPGIDEVPAAGRADEDHRGDGDAAKHVERIQSLGGARHPVDRSRFTGWPSRSMDCAWLAARPHRSGSREHLVRACERFEERAHRVHLGRVAPERRRFACTSSGVRVTRIHPDAPPRKPRGGGSAALSSSNGQLL